MPVALLAIAAIVAAFIRLPYDTIGPGTSRQVNDLVLVHDVRSFPPQGQVMYTTVSVRERVTPYEALIGWLDPNTAVESEKSVRGPVPPKQFEQLNVQEMADSKKVAEAVALEHLGYHVVQGTGAAVRTTSPGSPAAAVLRPNDVIVAVGGSPVSTKEQAADAIKNHRPGERLRLSVVRGGRTVNQMAPRWYSTIHSPSGEIGAAGATAGGFLPTV